MYIILSKVILNGRGDAAATIHKTQQKLSLKFGAILLLIYKELDKYVLH